MRGKVAAPAAISMTMVAIASTTPVTAQPGGKIELARMRPTGLLVDAYSYMTPPHNAYYFHHIDRLGFRLEPVKRRGPIHRLYRAERDVPATYSAEGRAVGLEEYYRRNQVTGFLVLHQDTVVVERYFHGATPQSRFVSQSVGKSIVSILVGAALEAGKITSVADPVIRYWPELAESGYRDVTIQQALQMATGVDYSENYRDSTSGAAKIGAALVAGATSFPDFVRSMKPTAVRAGTAFEYQSVNTQLLGEILQRATGTALARWTETALWSKLGAERDAFYYQAKSQRGTCAFACFNATLRDYGRVGLLMMRGGALGGRRIVSEAWVRESTTPQADFLRPKPPAPNGPPRLGYGYQWWIPSGTEGVFLAIGIFGQTVYVNPARGVVVVQTSAWPTPIGDGGFGMERSMMLDAVARAVSPTIP